MTPLAPTTLRAPCRACGSQTCPSYRSPKEPCPAASALKVPDDWALVPKYSDKDRIR